jgi:hypothetical protein
MIAFEGTPYYLDKRTGYHRSDMRAPEREYLHRAIYRKTYGNIPHGWQVHHLDEDTSNNTLENLVCMPMRDHVHRAHRSKATCEQCGQEYDRRRIGTNRWCSQKCAWTWHNAQR